VPSRRPYLIPPGDQVPMASALPPGGGPLPPPNPDAPDPPREKVPLDGPASDATFYEIKNPLLTPALHARLMTNTLKIMSTSGLNAAGEYLALHLAAALHASRAWPFSQVLRLPPPFHL